MRKLIRFFKKLFCNHIYQYIGSYGLVHRKSSIKLPITIMACMAYRCLKCKKIKYIWGENENEIT
jgi:hypothetical protein